jgi:aromatic ring-cleaving dioxygenase
MHHRAPDPFLKKQCQYCAKRFKKLIDDLGRRGMALQSIMHGLADATVYAATKDRTVCATYLDVNGKILRDVAAELRDELPPQPTAEEAMAFLEQA